MLEKNVKKINSKNFKEKKDCAIRSLKDVESFLHNFNTICKSFKIYKSLK